VLPVAFEALFVGTPQAGKSANAKQDPASPAQFAEMIDQLVNHAEGEIDDPDANATAIGAVTADKTASSSSSTKAIAAVAASSAINANGAGKVPGLSPSKSSITVVLAGTQNAPHPASLIQPDSGAEEAATPEGQLPQSAASKDVANKLPKNGQQPLNGISTVKAAEAADEGVTGDRQTESSVETESVALAIANPAPATSDKQPSEVRRSDKSNQDTTDPDPPTAVHGDDVGQPAATALNAPPVTAAIVAVIDVATPVGSGASQAKPDGAESSPKFPVGAVTPAKTVDTSTSGVSGQPDVKKQSLGNELNLATHPAPLTLGDLGVDAELEALPALTELAKTNSKRIQTTDPIKSGAPLHAQPQQDSAQPTPGLLPDKTAQVPQMQLADAVVPSHPSRDAETESQKTAPPQDDTLPRDIAGTAPKGSSALLSSGTLSFSDINIATTTGALNNSTATAAIPGAPQSAPATLVPVSGIPVEIASKALAGKNRFEIRLDPPELGRIHVHLDVDRSGEVSSHLVVDRSDTLDLLRRDAPSLERALQDAGLKTSNNGLQFSLRDHGFTRQDQPLPMPTNARLIVNDEALPAEATPVIYRPLAGLRSGLDIRV